MIILAFGSNRNGNWGDPVETVRRAIARLNKKPRSSITRESSLYRTAGVGPCRPHEFVNAVAVLECHMGPDALMRRLKQIEREAGPRSTLRWGPRTLDLDIIDYNGVVRGWQSQKPSSARETRPGSLILPHPMTHQRPFVLEPLREILPNWRHPVYRRTANELALHISHDQTGRILERLT